MPGIGKTALLPFVMAFFWSLDARFRFVLHLPKVLYYLSRCGQHRHTHRPHLLSFRKSYQLYLSHNQVAQEQKVMLHPSVCAALKMENTSHQIARPQDPYNRGAEHYPSLESNCATHSCSLSLGSVGYHWGFSKTALLKAHSNSRECDHNNQGMLCSLTPWPSACRGYR